MADSKKCDVCYKHYDKIKWDEIVHTNKYKDGRPIWNITLHSWGMEKDLDLCPECGEKLRDCLGRDQTCLK